MSNDVKVRISAIPLTADDFDDDDDYLAIDGKNSKKSRKIKASHFSRKSELDSVAYDVGTLEDRVGFVEDGIEDLGEKLDNFQFVAKANYPTQADNTTWEEFITAVSSEEHQSIVCQVLVDASAIMLTTLTAEVTADGVNYIFSGVVDDKVHSVTFSASNPNGGVYEVVGIDEIVKEDTFVAKCGFTSGNTTWEEFLTAFSAHKSNYAVDVYVDSHFSYRLHNMERYVSRAGAVFTFSGVFGNKLHTVVFDANHPSGGVYSSIALAKASAGTDQIHNLTQTATEADLKAGNYFALDGADGTKRFPAEVVPSVRDLGYEFLDETSRIEIFDGWARFSDGGITSNLYNKVYYFEVTEGSKIQVYSTNLDSNPAAIAFFSDGVSVGYLREASIQAVAGENTYYTTVVPSGAKFMAVTTRTSAVSNFRVNIFKPVDDYSFNVFESKYKNAFADDENSAISVVPGYLSNNGTIVSPINEGENVFVFDNKNYSYIECCVGTSVHGNNIVIGFYSQSFAYNRGLIGKVLCSTNTPGVVYSVQVPKNTTKIMVYNDSSRSIEGLFYIRLLKVVANKNDFENSGYAKKALNYQELDLSWTLAGNRGFSSEFKVYSNSVTKFKFASTSNFQFAIHGIDADAADFYDSGWKTDFSLTTSERMKTLYFWFRKTDNSVISESDISELSNALEIFSAETFVANGKVASIEYVDNSIARIDDKLKNVSPAKIIRNVAHQGFSTTAQYYGNSRLSSYVGAAKNGFDFGECDVQFSSDGVPVCCHDAAFVDGFSGNTITIAGHTAEELKTYQYYGETIATLEEVIAKCKEVGIGLYIDKTGNFMNDTSKRELVFSLVKKYAMEDYVVWLIGMNQSYVDYITSWYDKAAISVIPGSYSGGISDTFVTFMNSLDNGKRRVSTDLDSNQVTVETIKELNSRLKCGVFVEVWTIDNAEKYDQYKPYVSAITSNKLSELIVNG